MRQSGDKKKDIAWIVECNGRTIMVCANESLAYKKMDEYKVKFEKEMGHLPGPCCVSGYDIETDYEAEVEV